MKTIFLGDTHGRDTWKRILKKENPQKVIFIGDYFDSFDIPGLIQMANFKDIVRLKESGELEVVLLVGNHDYHYMDVDDYGDYSGFQSKLALPIKMLLKENAHHLQMAHEHEGWLCTHAGVTKTFCKNKGIDPKNAEQEINELFKHKPNEFGFDGYDGYGDDVTQGPIWVRPRSLYKDSIDKKQIVGHTDVRALVHPESTESVFYNIDTLDYKDPSYLVMEDGKMSIRQLKIED